MADDKRPRGDFQGAELIGEITEALHAWLREGAPGPQPPRIEGDPSYAPKDGEDVVFAWMYRLARNEALRTARRWRPSRLTVNSPSGKAEVYWERPPVYLDLFYLVCAHSDFPSDAERLLGWALLRLNDATHLLHRPRRYRLPDGREVDSAGRPWTPDAEQVVWEKVSVDLVDDLTLTEVVHLSGSVKAPYRPVLTWRARCAVEGALVRGAPTQVVVPPLAQHPRRMRAASASSAALRGEE